MRMRVEELAAQADVSIDTVRYYQKQRLLPSPDHDGRLAWYSEEHLERIARVKDLQRRGFTLAVIRRFLSGELDPADEELAHAVSVASGGPDEQSLDEIVGIAALAVRTGLPVELLAPLVDDGLLVPRRVDGEDRFRSDDVSTLAAGLKLVETGLPLPELLSLARHHHAMTREVAVRAVELFDEHVRKPLRSSDLPETEKAARLVEAFGTLMPAVTTVVANHFRQILLQVAQEHLESVGEPPEVAGAGGGEAWT
jgi:DNA-binding transcriptional MerR regulator